MSPDRAPENRTESLFNSWENKTEDEAERVLNVGVTRARKLVILAVPQIHADRCSALLSTAQVPHIREDLANKKKLGFPTKLRTTAWRIIAFSDRVRH